jgi:NAD(P)-dependent dehydrogenase (short-subunit alcohol dehydrogenase family)
VNALELLEMIVRLLTSSRAVICYFILTLMIAKVLALSSAQVQSRPTALVTGSTDGIGVTTAKHLLIKGYNVVLHGRDPHRIENACETIRSFQENDEGLLLSVCADIETVKGSEQLAREVQELCEKHNLQLTVLMNNAGVYAETLKITADGTEETFAVNVVAPFVILHHSFYQRC